MTDNEINVLICQQLDLLMPLDPVCGPLGVQAFQNFQPRQQGMSSTAAIYFVKISDKRFGFPKRSDVYVPPVAPAPVGTMRHTESQVYLTTFQFMALVPQSPNDPVLSPTESDVLNAVCAIIASDDNLVAMQAAGLGMMRITDVRNPYFEDERDRWEASPSFDVTFTHRRDRITSGPIVSKFNPVFARV